MVTERDSEVKPNVPLGKMEKPRMTAAKTGNGIKVNNGSGLNRQRQ